MNEVILEIRKRRINNIADLSEEDIRQILKKLGRSKYYEHRTHILSRLNGNPPPTITPEIEEKIRAMFQEIQAPFCCIAPTTAPTFYRIPTSYTNSSNSWGWTSIKSFFRC